MIIWVNGEFGAGKTTVAKELQLRLPDAMSFDPEDIGFLLWKSAPAPKPDDFHDVPAWRTLTAEFALALTAEYGRPLIVPMTVVNPEYLPEIEPIGMAGERLLHVLLDVPAEELRRRISAQVKFEDDPEQDAGARAFRLRNVERCVAARASLPPTPRSCGRPAHSGRTRRPGYAGRDQLTDPTAASGRPRDPGRRRARSPFGLPLASDAINPGCFAGAGPSNPPGCSRGHLDPAGDAPQTPPAASAAATSTTAQPLPPHQPPLPHRQRMATSASILASGAPRQ